MMRFILFFITVWFFYSCKREAVTSASGYLSWLNKEAGTCKITKDLNGLVISVKYLPAEYLALKEAETLANANLYDSLLNTYKNSITFLMTLDLKDAKAGDDVMFKDITDYKEYVKRSLSLNFDMESKVSLKTSTGNYAPVLSSLENTYGLTDGRDIYLVFTPKEKTNELINASSCDFVYNDDDYKLGLMHFVFNLENIRKHLPKTEIKKRI